MAQLQRQHQVGQLVVVATILVLSLFNATNFVDDQTDGNNGATGVGSSFSIVSIE